MAVVDIYIGGTIRSVKASSLSIDHQFSLRSTARVKLETTSYTPTVGNDFKVYEDGDLIFGGLITSVTRGRYAGTSILYSDVTAVDYSILASKRLTGERFGSNGYSNVKANDLFRDLVTNCLAADGISLALVPADAGPVITLAEFDYATVAEAFDFVADLVKLKWRIDFEKQLRLVDPAAPVIYSTITNLTGNYLADSLEIEETQEQYHNKVVVRGKRTTLPEATETFDGAHLTQPTDGTRREWNLTNRVFSAPTVKVDTVAQSVGVASVDTGKQWYWRPSSAVIEQDSTETVLSSASTLEITYIGEQVNQAFAEDAAGIAARATIEDSSGIWERSYEIDDPISSTDLQQYANSALELRDALSKKLKFATNAMAGIFPGDGIDCNLPDLGNHTYLVTSLQISMNTLGTAVAGTNNQLITRRIEAQFGPVLDNGFDFFQALVGSSTGKATGGSGSGQVRGARIKLPGVQAVGTDVLGTPYTVNLLATSPRRLVNASARCKVAPASQDYIVDVLVSSDDGATYASIFPSELANKIVIPVGAFEGTTSTFAISEWVTGDLIRVDVLQADGTAAAVEVVIQGFS